MCKIPDLCNSACDNNSLYNKTCNFSMNISYYGKCNTAQFVDVNCNSSDVPRQLIPNRGGRWGCVPLQPLRFTDHLNFSNSFANRSRFLYILHCTDEFSKKLDMGGGVTHPHPPFGTPLCNRVVPIFVVTVNCDNYYRRNSVRYDINKF